MARTEASNTFDDGLIMDLNPINTPNTALTDCLNGTIITYNGNELSLQNDMGNYGLKNCKLEEGYVPVGIKEYNGILYIVSHNPIKNKTEIGSFPSQAELKESETDPNKFIIESIVSQIKDDISYTEALKSSQLRVFMNPGFKLSSGDEYIINTSASGAEKYETIKYYILDTENKLYDVTSEVKVNNGDFTPITWQNPGYLAVKLELLSIDDLNINTKKMKSVTYGDDKTIIGDIEIQITTEEAKLFESDDVYLRIIYKDGDVSKTKDVKIDLNNRTKKPNGQVILWKSLQINEQLTTDVLELTAYPMLKIGEQIDENRNIYIKYDHVIKTQSYNLSHKINPDDFTIGENVWQYTVSDEDIKLTFDISGVIDDGLLGEDIFLFYKLYSIDDAKLSLLNGPKEINEWSIRGNTDVSIKFDDVFKKENVYLIQFEFYNNSNIEESSLLNTTNLYKIIVTSSLMNEVNSLRMDTIPLEQWLSHYTKSLDLFNLNIDKLEAESDGDSNITYSDSYNTWITQDSENLTNYTTAKSYELSRILKNGFTFTNSIPINLKSEASIYGKLLTGPIWKNVASNKSKAELTLFGHTFTYSFDNDGQLNASSGDIVSETSLSFTDTYTFEKSNEFTLKDYNDSIYNIHRAFLQIASLEKDDALLRLTYQSVDDKTTRSQYKNRKCYEFNDAVNEAIINDINKYGPIVVSIFLQPYTNLNKDDSYTAITINDKTFVTRADRNDVTGKHCGYFLATRVRYNNSNVIQFFKLFDGPVNPSTIDEKVSTILYNLHMFTISTYGYTGSFYTAKSPSRESVMTKEFIATANAQIKLSNEICLGNVILGTQDANNKLKELADDYKFSINNLISSVSQIDFGTYNLEPVSFKISADKLTETCAKLLDELAFEYTNGKIAEQNEKVNEEISKWNYAQTVLGNNRISGKTYFEFGDEASIKKELISAIQNEMPSTEDKLFACVYDHDTLFTGNDSEYASKALGFYDNEKL